MTSKYLASIGIDKVYIHHDTATNTAFVALSCDKKMVYDQVYDYISHADAGEKAVKDYLQTKGGE